MASFSLVLLSVVTQGFTRGGRPLQLSTNFRTHSGVREAGQSAFVWNGRDAEDVTVASGPYWAVLSSAKGFEVTAMMMIK